MPLLKNMTEPVDELHQPAAIEQAGVFERIRSEWKTLAQLGTPILVAQLAQMANGVIDTLMSGRAGADDLTGVAVGNSLWIPIFLFVLGVLNAQQPLISGYNGARQYDRIIPVAWHGIYIAVFATVCSILILSQVDPLLEWLQMGARPAFITRGYLYAFCWGIPAILLIISLRGLTDGLGHTRVIMVFTLLSIAINTPLNYLFIFGKLGLPEMGGIGCGWATAIANWISLIALLVYLHRAAAYRRFRLWSERTRPQRLLLIQLLCLGLPIGFTLFVEAIMFSVIALLLTPLGSNVVAGHQIALNIVSVMFMVPLSLGIALTLRISFLIGAGQTDSARLVARSSVILALVIAFSFALLLMINKTFIAGFYSTDAKVLEVAIHLLWFGALFQIVDVLQVNCINALRGFKDTRVPLLIMLFSFWVIGIPLGYILTFTDRLLPAVGAPGFWIGMTVGLANAALWLLIRLFWISRREKLA